MKTVFFGASRFVIPVIELLRKKFDLALVVTTEKQSSDPIPSYCNKHDIKYISVSSLSDPNWKLEIALRSRAQGRGRNWKLEIAVLAYFGLIIPSNILNIFPKGILNIHPSLLPKYRGPTPVQTAILNGDKKTGVTIIKLDEQMDHGPILAQVEEPILANDTAESLHERLFKIGADLLSKNIDQYVRGFIKLKRQGDEKATYTKPLTRADGFIDLNPQSPQYPKSPQYLDRMIRAYHPWPGVWTRVQIATSNKKRLTNNKSLEVGSQKLGVILKFLPERKLQVEGGKPMSYKDFINGYPQVIHVMPNLFRHLKPEEKRS